MTSAPTMPDTTVTRPSSRAPLVEAPRVWRRLRLKPTAPTTGWVDGGWWPRSRDSGCGAAQLDAMKRSTPR
jgi:hypothetical protein